MISGKSNKAPLMWGSQGFTLLEVMIALTVFTVFITAYLTSEGYKVADSSMMKKEMLLNRLCQNKLNEILLAPPPLEESLTLSNKEGNFEDQGFPSFLYTIQFRRLKLPELNQLQGSSKGSEGEESSGKDSSSDDGENQQALKGAVEKQIFDSMKKNIEELIWQVKVTVKEKGTDFPYSLSALINNPQARVKVDF